MSCFLKTPGNVWHVFGKNGPTTSLLSPTGGGGVTNITSVLAFFYGFLQVFYSCLHICWLLLYSCLHVCCSVLVIFWVCYHLLNVFLSVFIHFFGVFEKYPNNNSTQTRCYMFLHIFLVFWKWPQHNLKHNSIVLSVFENVVFEIGIVDSFEKTHELCVRSFEHEQM